MVDELPDDYDNTVHNLDDFEFEKNAFFLLLSSRKSGKSFMIKNLAYILLQRRMVNYIYVFSATARKAVSSGYEWLDKRCVMSTDLIDEGIEYLMNIQEKNNNASKILIILDDIDLNKSYANSIERLATRGRHYNITTILSAQVTNHAISHAIKSNSEYVFIRTLTANSIKKEVYSVFQNTTFEYPRDLYKFVKKNNSDYQFVLYLNDNRPPQDSIKVVKANEQKFKYVCKQPIKKEIKKKEDDKNKYDTRYAFTFQRDKFLK